MDDYWFLDSDGDEKTRVSGLARHVMILKRNDHGHGNTPHRVEMALVGGRHEVFQFEDRALADQFHDAVRNAMQKVSNHG